MNIKGIILAGGSGTRLYPLTSVISKHLLPVYSKPMIYYPLSVLMMAGIKEILIISKPADLPLFRRLLGDGKKWGIHLTYAIQAKPEGLAQAFIIGRKFIGRDRVCLILGDNIFYGHGLSELLQKATSQKKGGTIFAYSVQDPERYGVIELSSKGKVISIEEKPKIPKSKYAITGIYFFDNKVSQIASRVKPSARGELEITDVISAYVDSGSLVTRVLGRGMAWLDTGTNESLLQAANFVQSLEERQGLNICCPEEIAYQNGWINSKKLLQLAEPLRKTSYGQYLIQITKPL
jgi:glucose-1-phosphate thymidylyltransferase